MDARRAVADRGLVAKAVTTLTIHAFAELPVEAVGPTKAVLKRFFSAQDWAPEDDDALADAVGSGQGWWVEGLGSGLTLEFGWEASRFRLRVVGDDTPVPVATVVQRELAGLEATFDGPIVPEATPNPRTLAFRTGRLHEGDSRSYRAAAEAVDDPRVARLFDAFPDVATVLVARDFVALTVRRPDQWEALLAPVLRVLADEFAGAGQPDTASLPAHGGPAALAGVATAPAGASPARETRLDRAWQALGTLRAADPADLERVLAAAQSTDVAHRQVSATLVKDAAPAVARSTWDVLSTDPSRVVRRAAIDAMVDAGQEELRPLLERALGDGDAWVRWKALRGLAELGLAPSLSAVEPLAADPDFRVRLEAQAALRSLT